MSNRHNLVIGDKDCTFDHIIRELQSLTTFGNVMQQWTEVARAVGVTSAEIEGLRPQLVIGLKSQYELWMEILTIYRARNAINATLARLIEIFRSIRLVDAADKLQDAFNYK